jgi:hypothetical protein
VLTLLGCENFSADERAAYYEQLVNLHLSKGDSENEIVDFLKSRKWIYSYDNHAKYYQVRDPSEKTDDGAASAIKIYVNEEASFDRVEVETWRKAIVW